MKKLLTLILTLSLYLGLNAQDYYPANPQPREDKIPQWVKVTSIYAGSIILDAMADGLRDDGNKEWSHALEAGSIGLLLASPFIIDYDKSKWGWYVASYVTLRISLFDPTYNLTRGLGWNYVGTTSGWDKGLQKVPDHFMNFSRGVSFVIGISIPINELK